MTLTLPPDAEARLRSVAALRGLKREEAWTTLLKNAMDDAVNDAETLAVV